MYAMDRFTAGYQLGLLLQLPNPHCTALGLAVSGAYTQQAFGQDSKVLLAYISDWMTALLLHGSRSRLEVEKPQIF
jgi:hypothetical protein